MKTMALKKPFGIITMVVILFSMVACSKDTADVVIADPGLSLTIGAVTWASRNVDAANTFAAAADTYTSFYQFNRNVAWPVSGTVTGWTSSIDEDSDWTTANNPCPTGWRLPTNAEQQALVNAGSTWVEADARGNAVAGRYYGPNHATCRLDGDMTGCIFLPTVGFRNSSNGAVFGQGASGHYWSSVESTSLNGRYLILLSTGSSSVGNSTKAYGFGIRCVR